MKRRKLVREPLSKKAIASAAAFCLAFTLVPASALAATGMAEAKVPAWEELPAEAFGAMDVNRVDSAEIEESAEIAGDAEAVLEEERIAGPVKEEGATARAREGEEPSATYIFDGFSYDQEAARSILGMVNGFRTGSDAWYYNSNGSVYRCSGLATLAYDAKLEKAAMQRAAEIAVSFSHTRPNGTSCFTVFDEVGSNAYVYGENIAMGRTSAYDTFIDWREDNEGYDGQGHRRNMLDADYNAIGIGHVVYGGYHFWVQEFGDLSSVEAPGTAASGEQPVTMSVGISLTSSCDVTTFQDEVYVGVGKRADMPYAFGALQGKGTLFNVYTGAMRLPWTSENSGIAQASGSYAIGVKPGTTHFKLAVNGDPIRVKVEVRAQDVEGMNRLYNPNSGEHFYTSSAYETCHLAIIGWNYEGTGWVAPKAGAQVYRMYNPNAGDHHYTLSETERDSLVSVGWNYEGVGWCSDNGKAKALFRLYNPNAVAGSHHYTTSAAERDHLASVGWNDEGIGWYGM